ncbi:MAG: inositol monophosphatase family protein, partial [Roseibium sp.]
PTWGVLIALSDANGPRLGVIDQPYIGERFVGGAGKSYVDGPQGRRLLETRPFRPLDQSTVFTTFPEVGSLADRTGFEAVAQHANLVRYGMDCYAYALLAAGQIDLVIEADLNAYDIQGPIGVIEAAGGIVTNWQGGPAHQGGRAVAAANPEILSKAIDILRHH